MTTQELATFKKTSDDLISAHNQLTQTRETHTNTLKLIDKQAQDTAAAQANYTNALKVHEDFLKTIS